MKKCVLIYDDDAEILFLCEKILEKQYRVKSLLKCQYIIEDITRIQPDIILMDLWIPSIGGEKAIEIVKQNERSKQTPILIFSANANIKEIRSLPPKYLLPLYIPSSINF